MKNILYTLYWHIWFHLLFFVITVYGKIWKTNIRLRAYVLHSCHFYGFYY